MPVHWEPRLADLVRGGRHRGRSVLGGYTFALLNDQSSPSGMPVTDAQGKVVAVIGLGIRLRWLAASGQTRLAAGQGVDLLDKAGVPLVISDANSGSGACRRMKNLKQVVTGGAPFEAAGRRRAALHYAVRPSPTAMATPCSDGRPALIARRCSATSP